MSTSTIHISITFDHEPIELDILIDKLNWKNLITLIDSMRHIETPITLYYKKDNTVESLENHEQLNQLLIPNIKGLRFYGQKDLVTESVYVFPGNALIHLTQFIEENKSVIATSHRLARWVGILASFISQDTTDASFDHEFQVLEKLVERKIIKSKHREKQNDETSDEQQEDTCEELVGHGCGRRGRRHHGQEDPREALFGQGPFGRRGRHFGGCGRHGHHHAPEDPREALFGQGSFGGRGHHYAQDPRETFFGFGPFSGHGYRFGGRDEHFGGRGGRYGRPFGGHGHHFEGNPFSFGGSPFGSRGCHSGFSNLSTDSSNEESSDEVGKHCQKFGSKKFGKHSQEFRGKTFDKHLKRYYGRHGGFGRHASGFSPFGRGKGGCKKFGKEALGYGKEFEKHVNHFHFA